jgi:isocitrate dehydrogenase (NAD+)
MAGPTMIVVLEGDETGQELLEQALRVLDPDLLQIELELTRFDLSLEHRRETANQVVTDAAAAMRTAGLGLKAATVTPEGADDVGSPNRILREAVDGKVIIRTGRRLPGVNPIAGVYGAEQWREGAAGAPDEVAFRTERITRATCRAVAEYAFRTAQRMNARVYGGPKWTVSPVYEGMLKEEMDAAAERHADIAYQPVLIDATYAGLLSGATDAPLVIPALNRDGDCLSDLVLPMYGSIAGAESILLAFDENYDTTVAMAEAPHGTAPALLGKDVANPLAMILACGALLRQAAEGATGADERAAGVIEPGVDESHAGSTHAARRDSSAEHAARAIYESALEAVGAGIKTPDLGGHAGTTEFTDAVIDRVRNKLEIWSSLGSAA